MNINIELLKVSLPQFQPKNANILTAPDSPAGQSFKDSLTQAKSADSDLSDDGTGAKASKQGSAKSEKDDSTSDNLPEKSETKPEVKDIAKTIESTQLVSPEAQLLLNNPAADKAAADINTDLSDTPILPQADSADPEITPQDSPKPSPTIDINNEPQAPKILQIQQASEQAELTTRPVPEDLTKATQSPDTAEIAPAPIEENNSNNNPTPQTPVPAETIDAPITTEAEVMAITSAPIPAELAIAKDIPTTNPAPTQTSDLPEPKISNEPPSTFNNNSNENIQSPPETVSSPKAQTMQQPQTTETPTAQIAEEKTLPPTQPDTSVIPIAKTPEAPAVNNNDKPNQTKTDFPTIETAVTNANKPLQTPAAPLEPIATAPQPKPADTSKAIISDSDVDLKIENHIDNNLPRDTFTVPTSARTTNAPDFASDVRSQIQNSIQTAATAGNKQVVVRLNPVELGSVTMRLNENADGIVGSLHVERDQTREQIQKALPEIVQNLQTAGLSIKKIEVVLTNQQNQYDSDTREQSTFDESRNPQNQQNNSPSTPNDSSNYSRWDSKADIPQKQSNYSPDGSINLLV